MRYNVGSEIYTQGLAQALAERHEVHVFTRQENAFLPEYATQRETSGTTGCRSPGTRRSAGTCGHVSTRCTSTCTASTATTQAT